MKPTALLLALVALLVLPGCPDEECVGCEVPCEDPPTPFMPPMPGILLVGKPSHVSIHNARLGQCEGQAVSERSTITAELTDPDGVLIAQETFDPSLDIARFNFTLKRPGPHHFLVSFDPPGALLQFDLDAALDRSAETARLTLPTTCDALERTLKGAWVCDSAVYRGDTLLEQFPNARLAVAGDAVWVVTETQVRRFVDTGSTLTLTGTAGSTLGGGEFLLASPDELLVLHSGAFSLVRYAFDGAQLQASRSIAWSSTGEPVGPQAPRAILLRQGNQLAIITGHEEPTGPTLEVCPYQLTASGPLRGAEPCRKLQGYVAGFEPSVLWTLRPADLSAGSSLHRWVLGTGGLVEQSSIGLGFRLLLTTPPLRRPTAIPIVRSIPFSFPEELPSVHAAVTWSDTWRSLVLEHLDSELTAPLASPAFYWGRMPPPTTNTTTRVRIRPSTP